MAASQKPSNVTCVIEAILHDAVRRIGLPLIISRSPVSSSKWCFEVKAIRDRKPNDRRNIHPILIGLINFSGSVITVANNRVMAAGENPNDFRIDISDPDGRDVADALIDLYSRNLSRLKM